jgi:hypothetical protein
MFQIKNDKKFAKIELKLVIIKRRCRPSVKLLREVEEAKKTPKLPTPARNAIFVLKNIISHLLARNSLVHVDLNVVSNVFE